MRDWASEVTVSADRRTGIDRQSAAQCQHVRAVSTERIVEEVGNVGAVALGQIRETIAVLLDL